MTERMKDGLYRTMVKLGKRKEKEKEHWQVDSFYLKSAIESFKTIITNNFPKSNNRSVVIENLQGLIDKFNKQERNQEELSDETQEEFDAFLDKALDDLINLEELLPRDG